MLRGRDEIFEPISLLLDFFLIGISFYIVVNSKYIPVHFFLIFFSYILFWTLISNVLKLYESRRFMSLGQETYKITITHFSCLLLSFFLILLVDPKLVSYSFMLAFMAVGWGLTASVHTSIRFVLQQLRRLGYNTKYSLIIGNGNSARIYLEKVKKNPQLGYKVIGYLAPEKSDLEIPYLGSYAQLESVLNNHIVDATIVTASVTEEGVEEILDLLKMMGKKLVIMVDPAIAKVDNYQVVNFGGLSMIDLDSHPRNPWQEIAKQLFDFGLASVALILLSPLMLGIALAIKLTSKGPVIFAQKRVGLNGRIFTMYKFRTMVENAEELKAELAELNEMSGPVFKIRNDPRVTKVGRFLRRTSLDELPQLWNVLKQDISLVGPRPPLPSEVNMYDPRHRKRLTVKPGITCIWQVSGRNEVGFEQWMDMDAEYIERWSFWLDLKILAKTVPAVLSRRGAS
jgi:exopolysaccharide biosynthesis polyprenyl glycosylphosphotransferase